MVVAVEQEGKADVIQSAVFVEAHTVGCLPPSCFATLQVSPLGFSFLLCRVVRATGAVRP